MIRSVVALFVFAVALCAYIVTRPSAPTQTTSNWIEPASVSRAQTETLLPNTPLPSVSPLQTPQTGISFVPDRLDDSVAQILIGLGIRTPDANSTALPQSTSFEGMVIAALKDAKTDREIYQEINQAAKATAFAVPASLANTSGLIDTDTLLAIIVNEAQRAAGDVVTERFTPAAGSVLSGSGTRRLYTVTEGDSLARIAKMLYGDPALHVDIWAANLDILSDGYQVSAGQSLFIP